MKAWDAHTSPVWSQGPIIEREGAWDWKPGKDDSHETSAAVCAARLATLQIASPHSSARRCVWQAAAALRGRSAVLPQGELGTGIDCAAVAFNYVTVRSMQEASRAKVTFLHSDSPRLHCASSAALSQSMGHPVRTYGCTCLRVCLSISSITQNVSLMTSSGEVVNAPWDNLLDLADDSDCRLDPGYIEF